MKRRLGTIVVAAVLLALVATTRVPASAPQGTVQKTLQPFESPGGHGLQSAEPLPAASGGLQESLPLVSGQTLRAPPAGLLTFLPVVFRAHRTCSVGSPFSIQIAALHQIGGRDNDISGKGGMTNAEWLAWYEAAFPSLVAALQQTGACWTRVLIDWQVIQPTAPVPGRPPDYSWTYHDPKLALLAGTGTQLIATVEMVPAWARALDTDPPLPDLRCSAIDPERLGDFAQFLTDVVNRYKVPPYNIHAWELRNEPDGTTPDRAAVGQGCAGFRGDLYAQMLSYAYPAIKAADPTATVLMGGVAYDWFTDSYPFDPDGPFYRYFPDDIMAAGAAQYLDVTNLHYFVDFHKEWERWDPNSEDRRNGWLNAPTCGDVFDGLGDEYYAGGIDVIAKITHFRNRLSTCFGVNKPLWVTELAAPGDPGNDNSLAQQARYVIQVYSRGLSAGVRNLSWFALVTPPDDDGTQGLLYYDDSDQLVAKPSFYAYKTMTSQLAGWQYAYSLAVPDVEGYVFKTPQEKKRTVAWANGDPLEPAYLAFPGTTELDVADRWGNHTYIQDGSAADADGVQNGSVTLQLPGVPVDPDPHDVYIFTGEPYFITGM
jgi:O-glycosyl hydrolase